MPKKRFYPTSLSWENAAGRAGADERTHPASGFPTGVARIRRSALIKQETSAPHLGPGTAIGIPPGHPGRAA